MGGREGAAVNEVALLGMERWTCMPPGPTVELLELRMLECCLSVTREATASRRESLRGTLTSLRKRRW